VYLPLKLQLPAIFETIDDFRVVWFQDNNMQNPSPHWHIMIPTADKPFFLVALITSQYENMTRYYKNTKQPRAINSLVKINNDEFSFLSKDSFINCNATEYLSDSELIHRVDEPIGFKLYPDKVPAYLKKNIVSAIVQSPLIPRFVGNIAKASNPL